jgi:hypothetical protein
VREFDREMGERIANFSRIAYCPGMYTHTCTHTHSPKFSTGHAACVENREREREREEGCVCRGGGERERERELEIQNWTCSESRDNLGGQIN